MVSASGIRVYASSPYAPLLQFDQGGPAEDVKMLSGVMMLPAEMSASGCAQDVYFISLPTWTQQA